jgi:hypothetical protein
MSLSAPIPTEPFPPWKGKRGQPVEAPWAVDSDIGAAHDTTCRPSRSGRATAAQVTDYLVMAAVFAVLVYLWMQ